MDNLEKLYAAAMDMLDTDKAGYKIKGKNKEGYPMLECKDGSHSIEFITFNLGHVKEE